MKSLRIYIVGSLFMIVAFFAGGFLFPHLPLGLVQHKGHDDHKDHNNHKGHKGEGHSEHSGAVALSESEMAEFNIEVATAKSGEIKLYRTLTGEIVFNPDNVAHIVPRIKGIATEVYKQIGDEVKKGELLALLESPELAKLKVQYLKLKKNLELAQIDLRRMKRIYENTSMLLDLLKKRPPIKKLIEKVEGKELGKNRQKLISSYSGLLFAHETYDLEKNLREKNISSVADFLRAKNNYKKAQANYFTNYDEVSFHIRREREDRKREVELVRGSLKTLERRLQVLGLSEKDIDRLRQDKVSDSRELGKVELRAPFSGVVINKHITLGELITPSHTPLTIANLKEVWAHLSIYQKDVPLVTRNLPVVIASEEGSLKGRGKISYITPTIDEKTRTARGRVVIQNPHREWKPGLFVTGKVEIKAKKVEVLVPQSAIQQINEKPHVFVKVKDRFHPQEVVLGRRNDEMVEIKKGLNPGQKYISRGGFTLKSQMAKGSFESGHNH